MKTEKRIIGRALSSIEQKMTEEKVTVIESKEAQEVYYITNDTQLVDYDLQYNHLSKKEREANVVPVRSSPKVGRNNTCPCGSEKKYKNCCLTLSRNKYERPDIRSLRRDKTRR